MIEHEGLFPADEVLMLGRHDLVTCQICGALVGRDVLVRTATGLESADGVHLEWHRSLAGSTVTPPS